MAHCRLVVFVDGKFPCPMVHDTTEVSVDTATLNAMLVFQSFN